MNLEFKPLEHLEYLLGYNTYKDILNRYSEPWRHYHTIDHIMDLIDKIKKNVKDSKKRELLILASVFHDVIYYPWNIDKHKSNEYLSAEYFNNWYENEKGDSCINYEEYLTIREIILNTENHKSLVKDDLSDIFNSFDTDIIYSNSYIDILNYEKKIYKEFNMASTRDYKLGRFQFINSLDNCSNEFKLLKSYVKDFRPKVGYIAGSFNPFHKGHLNVLEQAKKIFDKVVLLIGQNSEKPDINDANERKINIFKKTACEVEYFQGFLTDELKKRSELEDVYLIRGIRSSDDLHYEERKATHMKNLWNDLNIMYLTCPPELAHISSSAIRDLNSIEPHKGDELYVPIDLF